MGIRAVIFDLDGTLLDTLSDIAAALNGTLRRANLPEITREQCRARVGWGMRELVRRSIPETAVDRLEELTDVARRTYAQHPVRETVTYPGISTLIERVRGAGFRTAILSNKPDDLVQTIVEHTLGLHQFDVVLGHRPEAPPKPDPTSTYTVLAALGADPGECLFVGDSQVDIQTAINAGCLPVGVSWGFRDAAELSAAGAVHLCYTSEDVATLLDV